MKTIGLIGGMSWESTIPYYRQINETIKERLGGLHSAKIVQLSHSASRNAEAILCCSRAGMRRLLAIFGHCRTIAWLRSMIAFASFAVMRK